MALASQSVRSQSMPRASNMFSRGKRARHKRIVGIVLLAVVCVGIALWAVRGRESSGLAAATGRTGPASALGKPVTGQELVAPSPMSGKEASLPRTVSTPPTLTMAEVKEPPAPALSARTKMIAEPPASLPAATTPSGGTPNQTVAGEVGGSGGAPNAADRSVAQGRPLEARGVLNRALVDPRSTESERAGLRKRLEALNQDLVFGPAQTPGDPFSETYRVVAGDSLVKITRKLQLITEPSLIARINKLRNPGSLKVGQTLKVLRGPFHAVVDKSEYRMDIYAGPTPNPSSIGTGGLADSAEPGWTYICSFPVGLGAQGLTPVGSFTIKENSKLVNPHWVNPRTGEKFVAEDPKNPIGERWMGLEGLDDKSKAFTGYGIHGTIDPASLGREMSMGCVRMQAADVEQVYELLTQRVSVVKIGP